MPSGFKIIEEPPSCLMAISKDILVLVEGFSKIIAIDLPSKGLSSSGADLFKFFLLSFLDFASSIILIKFFICNSHILYLRFLMLN